MNPYNCRHYRYEGSPRVCSYDGLYKVNTHVLLFVHNIVHVIIVMSILKLISATSHTYMYLIQYFQLI